MAHASAKIFRLQERTKLVIRQGDLTKVQADAIVNAANERMLGGGGVDGAIHRAAGPELREACAKVPQVSPSVRCPAGEARITGGFKLPAKHVIHTVGPIYKSEAESRPVLYNAYKNSLALANEHGLRTIAFPAISCGVYFYPKPAAAKVAMEACQAHAGGLEEVIFVLFGDDTYAPFLAAAEAAFLAAS